MDQPAREAPLPRQAADRLALLRTAARVVRLEAEAIAALEARLGEEFLAAVQAILETSGRLVVSGIGKAGIIGQKISATLASTGTHSFFLHPAEALHGDLGRVREEDLVLLISNSGESEEVVALIDPLRRLGVRIVAMTGARGSRLGRNADFLLDCGLVPEACPHGLAPTTSTAALLALGDALAMTLIEARRFSVEDYARFHPGGALGRKLMKVDEIMRQGERMTIVPTGMTTRETLLRMNRTKGRPGAAIVVDADARLLGFFTDGDLARHLEAGSAFLDAPIDQVMAKDPISIFAGRLASEALSLLRHRRIDQLPVIDAERRPVGLVDVQDLLDARIVT